MHTCASNLAQLLESDLSSSGWDASFIGPKRPDELGFDAVCRSLSSSLLSKFLTHKEQREKDSQRDEAALTLFLSCNEECKVWTPVFTDEDVRVAVGEAKSILDGFCHPDAGRSLLLTFWKLSKRFGLGKGANIGASNVDFYTKAFASEMTSCSKGLPILYRLAISGHHTESSAENRRESKMGTRIVTGSRLTFVPKKRTISRTICTEPTAEMLWQKAIAAILEDRLGQVFGIDLSSQPDKNRALARIGSHSGQFATVDLKSASDRNSIGMIRYMFPATFVQWLEMCRSPRTELPSGALVELYMMSSMGNAYTFPLQTCLFASVVLACYRVLGIKPKHPRGASVGNYAVFGDDIIVDKRACALLYKVLSFLGHEVNEDKSFSEGWFRESCGHDYFDGRDVRGVYIKSLHDVCDFYSAINRLNLWSARHYIPLERSVGYLVSEAKKLCKRKKYSLHLVPLHETEIAGIRVPEDMVGGKYFCSQYGRKYKFLSVASYKVDLSSSESLSVQIEKSARKQRKNPKSKYLAKAWYNDDGVLLSALAGKLRDGAIVVREFKRRTVVKARFSPCWDYLGPVDTVRYRREQVSLLTRINIGDLDPNQVT